MKPGGTLHIKPNFYTEYGMTDELRPQPCRVVYIHPERRSLCGRVPFRSGAALAGDVLLCKSSGPPRKRYLQSHSAGRTGETI